jgi:2-dehydropantoate 2-reductase
LQNGHSVVFVDRPESAELVRKKGLMLFTGNRRYFFAKPDVQPTIEDALTHGPFDAAIFAVKGYDTDRVLRYLQPYQVALPAFVCIQNGVGNEAKLVDLFGPDKVIPAVMTTSVRRYESGVAEVTASRGIGIAGRHQLIDALIHAFNMAGLNARLYHDPASMKWSKLLLNLMTNASCAILQMSPEEIIRDPELRIVDIRAIQEGVDVIKKQGLKLRNLPGYPIRWINMIMRDGVSEVLRDRILAQMVSESWAGAKPLLAVDLEQGKTESEVEWINGAVVRHGLQSDIATPVNYALTQILKGVAAGTLEAERFAGNKAAYLSYISNQQNQWK